jgi:hypothetical protein
MLKRVCVLIGLYSFNMGNGFLLNLCNCRSNLLIGQSCVAGTRIFIQEGVYDEFVAKFNEVAKGLAASAGDPFAVETRHGPQISQTQFDVCIFCQ